MTRQQFNVALSAEVVKMVKHAAIDDGSSLSQFVEAALKDYLRPIDQRIGIQASSSGHGLVMMPIIYTHDVEGVTRLFEALGARRRLRRNRDSWTELVIGHALLAVHKAPTDDRNTEVPPVELAFVPTRPLEEVKSELESNSEVEVSEIWDEAYGRTVHVTSTSGHRLQIAELDHELYP